LRDGHYGGAKKLGNATGYQYAHDHGDGWVDQEYIAAEIDYYRPTDRGFEAMLKARRDELRRRAGRGG
jgi:putative ATPase